MRALVLSGGGAKGAYQIGVWKALKKLNIKFDIVTGTSVGSINGALITQNSYFTAIRIWKKLSYEKIFDEKFNNNEDIRSIYKKFAKNFFNEGGTEAKELKKLINQKLNKKKFYNSKINYGLITFDITHKRPIQLEKKDIPKDKLADYILASASCFPAFKKMEINGIEYIDGGYYDNLPINLAIKMGADEAIVVDLGAIGVKRITKSKIKKITIKPNNDLDNFLKFDKDIARRNINYGYNDTMKIFNKYEGNKYTFQLNQLEKIENKYKQNFKIVLNKAFSSTDQIEKLKKILNIKSRENIKKELIKMIIEDIGYKYKIDDSKVYTINKFNKILIKKIKKKIKSKEEDSILSFYKHIKQNNYSRIKKDAVIRPFDLIRSIYIYTIMEEINE